MKPELLTDFKTDQFLQSFDPTTWKALGTESQVVLVATPSRLELKLILARMKLYLKWYQMVAGKGPLYTLVQGNSLESCFLNPFVAGWAESQVDEAPAVPE